MSWRSNIWSLLRGGLIVIYVDTGKDGDREKICEKPGNPAPNFIINNGFSTNLNLGNGLWLGRSKQREERSAGTDGCGKGRADGRSR